MSFEHHSIASLLGTLLGGTTAVLVVGGLMSALLRALLKEYRIRHTVAVSFVTVGYVLLYTYNTGRLGEALLSYISGGVIAWLFLYWLSRSLEQRHRDRIQRNFD